jgi:hypothetical protein
LAKQQAVTQVNLYVASSLEMKMPTQWSDGEGRRSLGRITETTSGIFRGSRDGMLGKINSPVLETRHSDVEEYQPTRMLKGASIVKTITSKVSIGAGGSGSYTWTVPKSQTIGIDYRIKISGTSNRSYTDTSDRYLSIIK